MTEESIASLRSELWEIIEADDEVARMLVSHKDNHMGTSSLNFQINTGFYTCPAGFDRAKSLEKGDWASLQSKELRSLDIQTGRVSVQVIAPLCEDVYYVVVREISVSDENKYTVKVGDKFIITAAYFYYVW